MQHINIMLWLSCVRGSHTAIQQ